MRNRVDSQDGNRDKNQEGKEALYEQYKLLLTKKPYPENKNKLTAAADGFTGDYLPGYIKVYSYIWDTNSIQGLPY